MIEEMILSTHLKIATIDVQVDMESHSNTPIATYRTGCAYQVSYCDTGPPKPNEVTEILIVDVS